MNRHPFPKSTSLPHRLFSWAGLFSLILALACSGAPVHAKPVIGHDASTSRHEIVFVESNVGDYQGLLNGVNPAMETHVLDADHDGLADMAQILLGRKDIDAIHIISHGSEGAVLLGALNLTSQNLQDHTADLATIGSALKQNGSILLYGCNVATGTEGSAFVSTLANATKMNIAASNNATGAQSLGGNWVLETNTGPIKASSPFTQQALSAYPYILASGTITFSNGSFGALFGADNIATDGEYSTDISGIVIQTYAISNSGGTQLTTGGALEFHGSDWSTPEIVTWNDLGGAATYGMTIKSSDGSNFQLSSLNFNDWGSWDGHSWTIEAFDNSVSQGTSTFNGSLSGANVALAQGGVLNASFNNIDEVRIHNTDGTGSWFGINDIVIANPVLPAPTVTDAKISISGASGTAGAFKIGDTVTATWDNTAGGDNNSGITGVTVDFSQFGGGAAIAATNSSETWTATFTIVAGAIDATNRNVSVTASNGSTTTTADSTNATVDNIAPTVTDARISISGASGTAGAFKIGDTVTATWDNTAGGDNNSDTISSVTVDFSAFGGGAAVAALNSSGTWTSTYTIVAGAIDGTNKNVSVTATDNAGNTKTTADTSNATLDNIAPTVTDANISISGATGTGGIFKIGDTITATWNNTAGGDNNSDTISGVTVNFSAFGGGAAVAATNSAGTWTASYTILAGTGSNKNVSVTATDNAGNTRTTADTSNASVADVPGAPTIGTATAGDTQASVAFSAPASDGGSAITGYTATSNPGGLTGSGASSPITVTGLTNGTAYTFTVTATNSIGTGSASAASNSVTPKASQTITFSNPGAQNFGTTPTLSATADSGLTVSFTSSTTGVCTITSGGALTFVTTGTCTIDADQSGNSSYLAASTVSQSFTVNAVVPGAPTIGTATAGDTQASVAFSAPASNGGATITGYTAFSNPGGLTGSGVTSPIVVTGLSNGTAYTFTVTATNSAGDGNPSAASNSVTPKASQIITFNNPGAQNFGTTPTLSATADSGLTVSFTSSTTGVCTITSGGALTFVTTGTCTIDADQSGNSSYLAASTVSRSFSVNAVVPGAPTIGTATAGNTQASVAFSAPASNGGATITGYTATSNPGGLTGSGASSPITVTGLSNGTAYTFTVTATNSAGTGSASAASNSVTPKASQTITFSNPGAQNFDTTPTLSATADSGLTVSFTSSTTGVCTITSGGALTFVTTGTCTIDADQSGNSSYLAAPTVSRSFTVNAVVPDAPTIGTATAGDTQATVAFSAPASNGGATITGYTATSNPGGLTGSGASSPITVTGLTNGTAYTFTVTATNSAGTGSASAVSNSVTPAPAPTVTSVAVPANGTYKAGSNLDFTISWDKNITVSGAPQIALTIGTATVKANYLSSTATTSLFRYTILAGQNDNNGIVVGALTLNGGTIRDANNVNATLTLYNVADTTGLLVDTTTPTVTINQAVGQTDPTNSSPIRFDVEFGEAVTGFNNADVIIAGMAMTPNITVSDSGDHIRYSVKVTGMTEGETVTATIPADAALDSSGNLSAASSSTDNSVTYRTTSKFPWLLLQPALNYNGIHRSAILPSSASVAPGK